MYRNTRTLHTVQPVIGQLFYRQEPTLFTITYHDEPVFILLPWPLYMTLRSLLREHGYINEHLSEPPIIGISVMAKRFLSFQHMEDTFQTERGACEVVFVLKRNTTAGAVIRYAYYLSLIKFLQERHVPHLEPLLTEEPDACAMQDRVLSLSELRNLATQLPHRLEQEKHWKGGDLPFVVTSDREPVLVVVSLEMWKKLLHLFVTYDFKDYRQEEHELFERVLLQLHVTEQDLINDSKT